MMSRVRRIRNAMAAVAAIMMSGLLFAQAVLAAGVAGGGVREMLSPWTLAFYNTHTQNELTVSYRGSWGWARGDALEKVNYFLRDHRNDHVHEIDVELLDLLHDLKVTLERRHPGLEVEYHVISAFRSRESNERMRRAGGGQAENSKHIEGKAIDIRVPGVSLKELRDTAWCLQRGGVGYYKGSNFIHVDTARVRYWHWQPKDGMCGAEVSGGPTS